MQVGLHIVAGKENTVAEKLPHKLDPSPLFIMTYLVFVTFDCMDYTHFNTANVLA